jgi:protein-tyrosine-phosphatase
VLRTITVSENQFNKKTIVIKLNIFRLEILVDMAPKDKKARIHMLGEFLQGREKIIEDPYDVSI